MPTERSGDPWAGSTYKGFSGGPAGPQADPPPDAGRRRLRRMPLLIGGGIAVALALGLGFGFWARPQLGAPPAATPAAAPEAPAPPSAAQVPIAVSPPPKAAQPHAAGKLETLPPEMAAATQEPGHAPPPSAAPDQSADEQADVASTPSMTIEPGGPIQSAAAPPAPAAPAEPAPPVRASFDCATARPGAEQVVCSDPELAADDRQLARAYRRALRAGVDPYGLRQEQRDWMAIREDAARRSRRDLAQVYDQRIQELNRMAAGADTGPGPGPDGGDAYGGE